MSAKPYLSLVIAAAIVLMLPSAASASYPPVPSGGTQAYLADANGDPQNGSFTSTGALTLTGAVTVSCSSSSWDTSYYDDGTGDVTAMSASGCATVGFPSCTTGVTPTDVSWPTRFYWEGTSFRSYKLVDFHVSISGSCPLAGGTYTYSGALSPEVSISGTTHTTTFDSGSGSVPGPFSSVTLDATLTGTVPAGSQYVF